MHAIIIITECTETFTVIAQENGAIQGPKKIENIMEMKLVITVDYLRFIDCIHEPRVHDSQKLQAAN